MFKDIGIKRDELANIVIQAKQTHENEWKAIEKEIFQKFKNIRSIIEKNEMFTFEDINSLMLEYYKLPPEVKAIIKLWINKKPAEFLRMCFSDTDFVKLLKEASKAKKPNDDHWNKIEELLTEIKEKKAKGQLLDVGPMVITSWFTIMNPQMFMPLWGWLDPVWNKITNYGSKLWGHGWWSPKLMMKIYGDLNDPELVKQLNTYGISTMVELAFYLHKYIQDSKSWLLKQSNQTNEVPSLFLSNTPISIRAYLMSRGYLYPPHLVSQFYTALKTKGFVILSGLTGTGKTKIAQELAELLDDSKNNLLFLSVRPDWRDSKPLLGYYNPLTGEYHKTPLLEFILRAKEDYEQNREKAMPYFIILDEMNLAHVEYYFADFLSVLESGRDDDGFTRESIKLHDNDAVETFQGIPKELKLPSNLYIVGTVNMDETTYSFSPKVLDRAFVVEFHDVELEEYPPERINLSEEEVEKLRNAVLDDLRGEKGKFLARSKEEINKAVRELKDTEYWRVLVELNKALEPYDMHFGYRIVDEIALFFINAKESWKVGIIEFENNNNENKVNNEIFDLALLMKVLPKFHGNRKKLEEPLKAVLKLCLSESAGIDVQELRKENVIELLKNWEKEKENFRFKHTAKKVLRMLRQLYEIGFASFS